MITTLIENGGRLDWSAANGLIAFDRRIGDGYFDIHTITPEGTNETGLTCGKPELPPKSKGNPAWHPSGEWIVFQAQNTWAGLGTLTDYAANPGSGVNNDLWVMDRAGSKFWKLLTVRAMVGGVLHPQFSRDGRYLCWSERVGLKGAWGEWALRVADFTVRYGVPYLLFTQTFQPGVQPCFYETHGFSPDGEQLLFSGNLAGQPPRQGDIYLFDLRTGQLKNLTWSADWDEHAHFSLDGQTIVWMTSKDLPKWYRAPGVPTDYWRMDVDGANKRRLTYFNTKGHPEYIQTGVAAADFAWSPDGSRIAAYLITDVAKGGKIVLIDVQP